MLQPLSPFPEASLSTTLLTCSQVGAQGGHAVGDLACILPEKGSNFLSQHEADCESADLVGLNADVQH
eukprot:1159797-Pyramimonas_sp.AAC.1